MVFNELLKYHIKEEKHKKTNDEFSFNWPLTHESRIATSGTEKVNLFKLNKLRVSMTK